MLMFDTKTAFEDRLPTWHYLPDARLELACTPSMYASMIDELVAKTKRKRLPGKKVPYQTLKERMERAVPPFKWDSLNDTRLRMEDVTVSLYITKKPRFALPISDKQYEEFLLANIDSMSPRPPSEWETEDHLRDHRQRDLDEYRYINLESRASIRERFLQRHARHDYESTNLFLVRAPSKRVMTQLIDVYNEDPATEMKLWKDDVAIVHELVDQMRKRITHTVESMASTMYRDPCKGTDGYLTPAEVAERAYQLERVAELFDIAASSTAPSAMHDREYFSDERNRCIEDVDPGDWPSSADMQTVELYRHYMWTAPTFFKTFIQPAEAMVYAKQLVNLE